MQMSECFTQSSRPSTSVRLSGSDTNRMATPQSWIQETVGGVQMHDPTSISWSAVPELLALRPSNRRKCLCVWTNIPSTSSECNSRSNRPCTRMEGRKWSVGSHYAFSPLCVLPKLLDNVQALNRVAHAFKWDECVWTRWEGSQQCARMKDEVWGECSTFPTDPENDKLWFGN